MDGTEERKDDITSGEPKGTSEKDPETLMKEQVDKIRSDAKSEIGRSVKAAEEAVKAARAAEERSARFIKQQEDAEEERYRDEPDKLTDIQKRRRDRQAEDKLANLELELEESKGKLRQAEEITSKSTKEQNAREIAARLNVNAETLIKFTDGSTEAMEDLAKVLPKKGEATTLTPDSGKTTGGGKLTLAQLKAMSSEERFNRSAEIAEAFPLGIA